LVVLSVLGLLTRKQECCHAAFHLVLLNAQHFLHTKDENPEGSGYDHATHNQRTKESEVAVSYVSLLVRQSHLRFCHRYTQGRQHRSLAGAITKIPSPLTGMKTCLFCIDSNRVVRDWNVDDTHLT